MKTFLKQVLIGATLLIPAISTAAPSNNQLRNQQQWDSLDAYVDNMKQRFENQRLQSQIDDLKARQNSEPIVIYMPTPEPYKTEYDPNLSEEANRRNCLRYMGVRPR